MSKYTTEVRWICEQAYNDAKANDNSMPDIENASITEIVDEGIKKIFDSNADKFPIYDENHRKELCEKILKHYYTREICAETFGLWKLWLNNRMREIMPYYNELYMTVELDYNPIEDVNYKRTGNRTDINSGRIDRNSETAGIESGLNENKGSETGNEHRDRNNSNTERYSDTPQNGLTEVRNDRYLTNATLNDGESAENSSNINTSENEQKYSRTMNDIGKSTQENQNTNAGNWIEEIKGKMGQKSYAKLVQEYRKAILNVDMMIIDELKDLFFYLW